MRQIRNIQRVKRHGLKIVRVCMYAVNERLLLRRQQKRNEVKNETGGSMGGGLWVNEGAGMDGAEGVRAGQASD